GRPRARAARDPGHRHGDRVRRVAARERRRCRGPGARDRPLAGPPRTRVAARGAGPRGRLRPLHARDRRAAVTAAMSAFSWSRFLAVLAKEFVQMRRDRLTFAMMVGIPITQL